MMTWGKLLKNRLAADTEEAAEFLRAILAENDAQLLLHALRRVKEARGSLDELGLSQAQLTVMLTMLANQPQSLPHAA